MTISIKKRLENVLIHNGKMEYGLYEYELEALLDELKLSLIKDRDEFIFAVTENNNDVAMVLIEKSGEIYINELAREKLKDLWHGAYLENMKKLIPTFAKQLKNAEIPINGVQSCLTQSKAVA
jgi:hypothetical protein